ncbi:MAG: hypothetical protein ACE5E9_00405 [Nitrospinaceae bacterium]
MIVSTNSPARIWRIFFWILIFSWASTSPDALAQEPGVSENHSPISAEAKVDLPQATIGDIVTFSVIVRHDANIQVHPPQFVTIPGLETLDRGAREPRSRNSQKVDEFWIRFRVDRVGTINLPAVRVPFDVSPTGPGGNKIPGFIAAPKVSLEVQSILRLQGEPTDIRDIKPLEEIGLDWRGLILAGILLLLGSFLGIFFWRSRKKRTLLSKPAPQSAPLPHERALRELEALRKRQLLESGQDREYYFQLSEIFRRYLGNRFAFPALDWTTEEITEYLHRASPMEETWRDRVCRLLEKTDRVKFAKAQRNRAANEMEEVINFIRATCKKEEEPVSSSHPSGGS